MVKLIRKGRQKEKEQECNNCNSLFSFEIEDLQEENYGAWNAWIRYFIVCPACKNKIFYETNPFTFYNPNSKIIDKTEKGRI